MSCPPPTSTRRALLAAGLAGLLPGCGGAGGSGGAPTVAPAEPPAQPQAWSLEDLERRCFDGFWEQAHPQTGLTPDRWPSASACSVAAMGFGLSALVVGATRGWVSRPEAAQRARLALSTLLAAPQGEAAQGTSGCRGFFYHFLEPATGLRAGRSEVSTVDTALLMAGVLLCERYFDRPEEAGLRTDAAALHQRVDWRWAQVRGERICHGWTPEAGFLPWDWAGYNEAMLVPLLALGSETHAVAAGAWEAWCAPYADAWGSVSGSQPHLRFAPLFGHQFTHAWVDFRGLRDAWGRAQGLDYFENSVRATDAQRRYARANPQGWLGYSDTVWGLSACDGPGEFSASFGGELRRFHGYAARGAAGVDDGTLAPGALGASLPFAPQAVEAGLQALRSRYPQAWGRHGFVNALNPSLGGISAPLSAGRIVGSGADACWVATDYLGIDLGPLLLMLANQRDGLVWRLMREHPVLQRGLDRAGFLPA